MLLVCPKSNMPTSVLTTPAVTRSRCEAGQPKAIPWTHTTPIRSAANAFFHQDVREGDTVAWPTNLGWMMGPWLVFAALLNGATIALFQGSPLGRDFGVFIQSAGVSMLGLVPSIAKTWRASDCMKVCCMSAKYARSISMLHPDAEIWVDVWLCSKIGSFGLHARYQVFC